MLIMAAVVIWAISSIAGISLINSAILTISIILGGYFGEYLVKRLLK